MLELIYLVEGSYEDVWAYHDYPVVDSFIGVYAHLDDAVAAGLVWFHSQNEVGADAGNPAVYVAELRHPPDPPQRWCSGDVVARIDEHGVHRLLAGSKEFVTTEHARKTCPRCNGTGFVVGKMEECEECDSGFVLKEVS